MTLDLYAPPPPSKKKAHLECGVCGSYSVIHYLVYNLIICTFIQQDICSQTMVVVTITHCKPTSAEHIHSLSHFITFSCDYLISQLCGSCAMNEATGEELQLMFSSTIIKMWSKWLWPWNYCWLQTVRCVSQKLLICWDFQAQQSLEVSENGAQNKEHPVSSSFAGRSVLLKRVRGEGPDWSKLTRKVTVTQITTHSHSRSLNM